MPTYIKLSPKNLSSPQHEYQVQVKINGVTIKKSKRGHNKKLFFRWALDMEAELLSPDEIKTSFYAEDVFNRYGEQIFPSKKGCKWEKVRLKNFGSGEL